jgi:hypothetical protein
MERSPKGSQAAQRWSPKWSPGKPGKVKRKTESNNRGNKEDLKGAQEVDPRKALRGPGKDPNWDPGGPRKGPQKDSGRPREGS